MLGLPVMQSTFGFTDIEGIKVPTTSFVNYFRSLSATEPIFVWKERLNPASILKNNLKIDKLINLPDARFNTSRKSFALGTQKRQD